jgi:hypothetical protein
MPCVACVAEALSSRPVSSACLAFRDGLSATCGQFPGSPLILEARRWSYVDRLVTSNAGDLASMAAPQRSESVNEHPLNNSIDECYEVA